jgi:C-terminal processing protease CtpA/Prc
MYQATSASDAAGPRCWRAIRQYESPFASVMRPSATTDHERARPERIHRAKPACGGREWTQRLPRRRKADAWRRCPGVSRDDIDTIDHLLARWWANRPTHEADGVDPGDVVARLRAGAAASSERWSFVRHLRSAMYDLHDGHLRLTSQWPSLLSSRSSSVVVVDTADGPTVAAGPLAGAVIEAVDGQPIERHLDEVRREPGSTLRQRRSHALRSLTWREEMPGEVGAASALVVRHRTGVHDVALDWQLAPPRPTPRCVSAHRPSPEVGVLLVQSFDCRDELNRPSDIAFRDQLADATRRLIGVTDLVIDLRWNGGGRDEQARALAAMCCAQPIAWVRYRHVEAVGEGSEIRTEMLTTVGPTPFARTRLWLLTSPRTASTAEILVAAIASGRDAVVVGEPTAGSVGNPIPFRLMESGVTVTVPVTQYFTSLGEPIEGRGFMPDIGVTTTADDLDRGSDPVLAAVLDAPTR